PQTGVELLDAVKKVKRRASNKPYLDARQQTLYIGCSVQDFFADGLGSEAIRNRTSGLSLDEQAMMKARWKAGGM
ncbi:MAG: hypothetical protein IMZ71_00640, partial [Chloroflexi bacterium]|nr:hypothetical protein [Chloroflexota bacterium]